MQGSVCRPGDVCSAENTICHDNMCQCKIQYTKINNECREFYFIIS